MKILTVVGARPQFIKAAAGSMQLRKEHQEVFVHTGQHFDENMSKVFFKEMEIPMPDYHLGISGGNHGEMTGKMMIELEKVMLLEQPDALLVYGDTNSTLSAALSAVKLHIPIMHVESGTRLGTLQNPEEINRILTDHCSSILFCPTQSSKENLEREGLVNNAFVIGNIMYDSFLNFANRSWQDPKIEGCNGNTIYVPEHYYLMTCHRQENTVKEETLLEILLAMQSLDAPTIYPVHPRTRQRAIKLVEQFRLDNILLAEPVKYSDSVQLVKHAKKIVTDSGGLQCEAFFAGVQCVFIFDGIAWPETMVGFRNQLARPQKEDLLIKLSKEQTIDPDYRPFGDGHAAEKMCDIIRKVW